MDGYSIGGIAGAGGAYTKVHDGFLLVKSRCLLGVGALVALAFVAVEVAVASSTSA